LFVLPSGGGPTRQSHRDFESGDCFGPERPRKDVVYSSTFRYQTDDEFTSLCTRSQVKERNKSSRSLPKWCRGTSSGVVEGLRRREPSSTSEEVQACTTSDVITAKKP
jgi:hypothetical protein